MARDFDIVVIGAGAVGAGMAALLLARQQVARERIAVIGERLARTPPARAVPDVPAVARSDVRAQSGVRARSEVRIQSEVRAESTAGASEDWDLRVFALSRASQRLLELAGVWPLIPPARKFPYERMCVWDAGGAPRGAGSLTFDCAEIGEPNLGHIVDGRLLGAACLKAAAGAGAVLIEGSLKSIDVSSSEARVQLEDGREFGARLLIAADGTASRSRELLGIEMAGHDYHQEALVAHVRTGVPHENTAWQRFLATGPLAFLPLSDGRSSIVWSVGVEEAKRLRALDAAGFAAALEEASGGFLGTVELTTPVAAFPLKLAHALDYARPRAVLLGDAGHAVHPLAGQGLNLGLLDCAALADVLGEAGGDAALLGDLRLLRRYERWRKSENLLAATALDGLERLFSSSGVVTTRLRMAGLGAVERMPFVKRHLAKRALGLAGDVPGFLR
jgi:2-polyprenylphenol 6-hydroxylase